MPPNTPLGEELPSTIPSLGLSLPTSPSRSSQCLIPSASAMHWLEIGDGVSPIHIWVVVRADEDGGLRRSCSGGRAEWRIWAVKAVELHLWLMKLQQSKYE